MQKSNPNGEVFFEKWEIETAKYWAKRFKSEREDNEDDLLQECLIKWLDVRDTFQNKKAASRRTYMSRVMRNHLIGIDRKSKVNKRKTTFESISMDEICNEGDKEVSLHDSIGMVDKTLSNSALRLDIHKALQNLTPQQLQLCNLIMNQELSSSEIASILKKHKSTVCRDKILIRNIFKNEGLKNWLDDF